MINMFEYMREFVKELWPLLIAIAILVAAFVAVAL